MRAKRQEGGEHGKSTWHNYVLLVASFISLGVTLAGTFTDVFTYSTSTDEVTITLWKSTTCKIKVGCLTEDLPSSRVCLEARDRQRSLQSFAILSVVSCAVLAGLVVLDILGHCPIKFLPALAFLVVLVFVIVEWALMAGTYHYTLCDSSSYSSIGLKLSVSFALFFCLWITDFGVFLYYLYRRFVKNAPG